MFDDRDGKRTLRPESDDLCPGVHRGLALWGQLADASQAMLDTIPVFEDDVAQFMTAAWVRRWRADTKNVLSHFDYTALNDALRAATMERWLYEARQPMSTPASPSAVVGAVEAITEEPAAEA